MAQVKFYSVAADATKSDAAGIYFVNGGELYKGTSRFGANKVFTVANADALAAITGQIGGDIAVGFGAAKVWDAEFVNQDSSKGAWRDLGADNNALASLWQADISTWTAGLVAGGAGSYITGITQGEDGKVTATAAAFPELNLSANTESSTANGITVSVTTESGAVTGVQVAAADISATSVTAASGTFTNLTVSDTAAFNATTVSASSLTIDGVAVNNVSASYSSDTDNGVTVSVSTANGGVKSVDVTLVKADVNTFLGTTAVADKSVATTIRASDTASNDYLATEKAVRDALNNLDNAMHFKGVVAALPSENNSDGDIVVIGASPSGYVTPAGQGASTAGEGDVNAALVAGQEYIWDGTKWELIGDQNTYAAAATVTALASRVTDIEGIVDASTSTVSASTGTFTNLTVGGSTVSDWADTQIAAIAEASASDADKGVTVSVVTQSGSVKSVDVAVVASSTMALNDAGSADVLATTAAVKSFYDNNLVWLDASGVAIA